MDNPGNLVIGLVERENKLECMFWYNLGIIIRNEKRAESGNIKVDFFPPVFWSRIDV